MAVKHVSEDDIQLDVDVLGKMKVHVFGGKVLISEHARLGGGEINRGKEKKKHDGHVR